MRLKILNLLNNNLYEFFDEATKFESRALKLTLKVKQGKRIQLNKQ